jgi:hypothetical protein
MTPPRSAARAALALTIAVLATGVAHAQREPALKGTTPHAAVLMSTPPACVAEISKQMRDINRYLPASDIPADLFTKTAYETVRTNAPDYSGKPGVYPFHLSLDPYDKVCRLVDRTVGWIRQLPSCECAHVDAVAAAQPFGQQLTQLNTSGNLKALEETCAASANPIGPQAAEYRKTMSRYFDFKVRTPALLESVKRKPASDQLRAAWEFAKAKADLAQGVVSEKAYNDTLAELKKVDVGDLDTACKGAANMIAEKIAGMALEMKLFATTNKVTLD